jgi:hypothetical protein
MLGFLQKKIHKIIFFSETMQTQAVHLKIVLNQKAIRAKRSDEIVPKS